MSRPRPTVIDPATLQPEPDDQRPASVKQPPILSDLAYDCEALVIRDPCLPHALVHALLDIAAALRQEARRRSVAESQRDGIRLRGDPQVTP
ncbi:hypothetical protein ACFQY5_18510 [Paeniroseomonas aquatica]|uniref:Uncharacterized protein n=1 Tax=Paeniroseomonas aquatica TaxID=373043 RepID=A0ABT8AGW5_9PROT|nr:hypothetical protein [Paeniroseomonas aquatica]MDN3568999.1 hypothetical protein [Paeniroseomonas aquatica]